MSDLIDPHFSVPSPDARRDEIVERSIEKLRDEMAVLSDYETARLTLRLRIEHVAKAIALEMEQGYPRYTQQTWEQMTEQARQTMRQRASIAIRAADAFHSERIVAAAMIYNGVVCSLPAPARHNDIIREIAARVGSANWPVNGEDGFTTSTGRFVGRNLGMEIARAAGQTEAAMEQLFSEDLW